MAKQKQRRHVPQRTCIVCREKRDKRQLTRIVLRQEDGSLAIDPRGKEPGRGAYLCNRETCWQQAMHSNLLDRALKSHIAPAEKEALAAYQPEDNIEQDVT